MCRISAIGIAMLWGIYSCSTVACQLAPVAAVYAAEEAKIDGSSVPYGVMAISPTQTLQTGNIYTAVLDVRPHSLLFASPQTQMIYMDQTHARLQRGDIAVKTTNRFSVLVRSCGEVSPKQWDPTAGAIATTALGLTAYEIALRGNTAFVYARQRDVEIKASNEKISVPADKLAIIERIDSSKCKVALYDSLLDRGMPVSWKLAWGGTIGTAVSVPFWFEKGSATIPVPSPTPPVESPAAP
jgi:hypothetical protein